MPIRQVFAVSAALAVAALLGVLLTTGDSAAYIAQGNTTPGASGEDGTPVVDPYAWVETYAKNDPLNDAQLARIRELLPKLGSDSWDEREGAMLELLLMPAGMAAPLVLYFKKHKEGKNLNDEARMRLDWLLREVRRNTSVQTYVARVIGVERVDLERMVTSPAGFSEILERLPEEGLTTDKRFWAYLMLGAETTEQVEAVASLLETNAPELRLSAIYQSMREQNPGYRPERRAAVLGRVAHTENLDELLEALQVSDGDRTRLVFESRDLIEAQLLRLLGPAGLLERFDSAENEGEKIILLGLATFKDSPEIRAGWLERGNREMTPEVQQAYFSMVARTGLTEAVSAHLSRVGPSNQVFQMLCVQDDPTLWNAMLDSRATMELSHQLDLLSWLPYSNLPRNNVIATLLDASEDPALEAMCASVLTGMVSQRVLTFASSKALREKGNNAAWLDLLSRSGQAFLRYGLDVRKEAWLSKLSDLQSAWLESSLGRHADAGKLKELCYSGDARAAEVAVVSLIGLKDSRVGSILGTQILEGLETPPTMQMVDQAMLGEGHLLHELETTLGALRKNEDTRNANQSNLHWQLRKRVMAGFNRSTSELQLPNLSDVPSVKFLVDAFDGQSLRPEKREQLLSTNQWYAIEEADVLQQLGEGQAIVEALTSLARRQVIPSIQDNPRLESLTRALGHAFAENHEMMGVNVAVLSRGRNELVLHTALQTILMHGSSVPFAQNLPMLLPQQNIRMQCLLAAALSPELPIDWITYQENTYGNALGEFATVIFPFLVAVSRGNMNEVSRYLSSEFPWVNFAAKRVLAANGNIAALQAIVDEAYLEGMVNEGGWAEHSDSYPLHLEVLISNIDTNATPNELRWYWRSTRNLHIWNPSTKRYEIDTEE